MRYDAMTEDFEEITVFNKPAYLQISALTKLPYLKDCICMKYVITMIGAILCR